MLVKVDSRLQLCQQGYLLRVIDISWVSLCVPMRPGKNSFVMMRGARRLHGWYAVYAGAGWLHSAATNPSQKKDMTCML